MIHTVKGFSTVSKAEVDIFLEFPCFFYDPTCMCTQSCPILCDPMDCIACQAPLSMEFSRQEYRSGLPFSTPGNLSDPGISLAGGFFATKPPGKPHLFIVPYVNSLSLSPPSIKRHMTLQEGCSSCLSTIYSLLTRVLILTFSFGPQFSYAK